MKFRRRWKTAGLSAALLLSFAAGVWADDGAQKVEAYLRKDFRVTLNDTTQKLEYPPLIYNNSSYLHVRDMSRLLGVTVQWEDSTGTIKLYRSNSPSPAATPAPTPTPTYVRPSPTPPPVATPTPLPSDDRDFRELWDATPAEMKLGQIARYQVTYQGKQRPWLGNVYEGTIFIRIEDVAMSGLSVSGLKLTRELLTGQYFVSIDLLRTNMTEQPFFRLETGLLVYGETDAKKLEVIRNYLDSYNGAIHHELRAQGNNQYTILVEYPQFTGDGRWGERKITLSPNSTANGWYISQASTGSLPGAFASPTPTP